MALAATYAGLAFTRANVGYVHAIAHQLGGRYHVPHGLANAILLPVVLAYLQPAVTAKLAVLAVHAGVGREGERAAVLAGRFVESVVALNRSLHIPAYVDALEAADIPELAKEACWEADTNYPVPRYMSPATCARLLRKVLPAGRATRRAGARSGPARSRA
ncbi:MAG TPA: iron-containing alcohol dehydrogenase, partial [Casimicrobiaceae bacterium]|nr:iron-containing alcohol dehydrogenase [Casimicrobiaceae bacterium]